MVQRLIALLFVALFSTEVEAQTPVPTAAPPRDTIHFDYDRDHLFVNATINDSIHGRFVFDTGAAIMLLDNGLLARHGFTPLKSVNASLSGIGSNPVKAICMLDTVTYAAGNYARTISPAIVYDFHSLVPWKWIDGILGLTYMADTTFAIDYARKIITFPTREELDALEGYQKVPFVLTNGLMELTATLVINDNYQISSRIHIDTGNPGTIDLTPTKRNNSGMLRKLPRRISYDLSLAGVGGGARLHMFEAQKLILGNVEVLLSCAEIIEGSTVGKNKMAGGIVGNDILRRFHFIADMKNSILYLKPNELLGEVIPIDISGIYLSKVGSRTMVNGLSHHPTQLRVGDVVTHIDGREIAEFTSDELTRLKSTPDLEYILTVVRGDETLKIKHKNLNNNTLWQ